MIYFYILILCLIQLSNYIFSKKINNGNMLNVKISLSMIKGVLPNEK